MTMVRERLEPMDPIEHAYRAIIALSEADIAALALRVNRVTRWGQSPLKIVPVEKADVRKAA
jgi:hypothetical protein